MKNKTQMKIIMIFLTLLLVIPAQALLIEVDFYNLGDKLVTRDTETGLDWLDLSLTNGMSYLDVLPELSINGEFDGFRYATTKDVSYLQQSARLPLGDLFMSFSPFFQLMENLIEKVGITNVINDHRYSNGLTSDEFNMAGDDYLTGRYFSYDDQSHIGSGQFVASTSNTTESIGSWLIQKSPLEDYIKEVPEPTTLLLFLLGFLGVFNIKRKTY